MKNTKLSPVTSKFAEISALESKLVALRTEASEALTSTLRALPAQYGFSDVNAFIKAVRTASKGGVKTRKARKNKKAATPRKARASITPEKRAAIIADLTAKMPSLDVASKHEISLATVQNIKKAAGLVTARS